MEHEVKIELTDLEYRAWSVFIADPQEWIETLVRHEVTRSMRQIYEREVARLLADPEVESIPASIEAVVAAADLTSAKERDARVIAALLSSPEPPQG